MKYLYQVNNGIYKYKFSLYLVAHAKQGLSLADIVVT